MKKSLILLTLLIALVLPSARAQIAKGEKYLGGYISFYSQNSDNDNGYEQNTTSLALSPRLGFGLGKSWVVGPVAGYSWQKQHYESGGVGDAKTNFFTGGVFVRKFFSLNNNLGFFADGQIDYGGGSNESRNETNGTVTESKYKDERFSVGIRPGLYAKATKKLLFEATMGNIGYIISSSTPDGGVKSTNKTFQASLTNSVSFGVALIW